MKRKNYFVYILTNVRNTVLYIGVTNNLKRRIYEHKSKQIKGFTSKYNLTKLVYYETFDNPSNAIKGEKSIKNLVRRKKISLINTSNKEWIDLYTGVIE